jgi:hypothetical protein
MVMTRDPRMKLILAVNGLGSKDAHMHRQTVAEIVAARRAKIDEFDADPSDKDFDLSPFTDALEHTPIKTKADALAALEVIREGVLTGGTHLPIVAAKYIEQFCDHD